MVEDNGYAISIPVEVNTAGGNISRLVADFPNFHFEEIDGTDPIASYGALKRAVAYCRASEGPALVHGHVIRPYSHSLSDDERLYRPGQRAPARCARDPISRMQMCLLREGILDENGINKIEKEVDEEVQSAADRALMATLPQLTSITKLVYSQDLIRLVSVRAPAGVCPAEPATEAKAGEVKKSEREPKTMADLINAACTTRCGATSASWCSAKMWPTAAAKSSCEQKLIKGKGGVFKLTAGLQMEFGSERVFNSPLAEANIVGRAMGMATRGYEAGGRDSVLRLHLAGDAPDAQ